MPRYLVEVEHDDATHACQRAIHSIEARGASFVGRAEWGCRDGVHRGWLIVETSDRATALMTVPPELRSRCRVVRLNRWTWDELVATEASLKGRPLSSDRCAPGAAG